VKQRINSKYKVERIHLLHTKSTELSGDYGEERVTSAITVNKLLDVRGLDLTTVVDYVAVRVDESLSDIKRRMVNFREAERNVTTQCQPCISSYIYD
jgi:hypothetical protein